MFSFNGSIIYKIEFLITLAFIGIVIYDFTWGTVDLFTWIALIVAVLGGVEIAAQRKDQKEL